MKSEGMTPEAGARTGNTEVLKQIALVICALAYGIPGVLLILTPHWFYLIADYPPSIVISWVMQGCFR